MLSEQKKQAKSIGMTAGTNVEMTAGISVEVTARTAVEMTAGINVEVTAETAVEMTAGMSIEVTAGTTVVIILIISDGIDTKDRVDRTTGMGIIILEIIQKMIGSAANVKT